MPHITISGLSIAYELLGPEGAPAVAITPGGRFAMDSPGVRELGLELAAKGKRVLMWDRPNCGSSQISFDADNESELQAQTLTKLIRALDLGPTALAAGSGGSRVALMAASRDPDIVSHLLLWWVSGGKIGLLFLAYYYAVDLAVTASQRGMQAVADAPAFAQQIARFPQNRDIILAQDPKTFIETMERWAEFYLPKGDSPVPGMTPEHFKALRMPTLIFRSGESDLAHPRRTSEWVHELIPHSKFIEPPWGDTEWNDRCIEAAKEGPVFFRSWPKLAPSLLDFIKP